MGAVLFFALSFLNLAGLEVLHDVHQAPPNAGLFLYRLDPEFNT